MNPLQNPWLGWALAAVAVAAGYIGYGWQGVALAVTVVVFWLLLQFSRALRVMRNAAGSPVGHTDNAVMLQSRLQPGMRMLQVVTLTRSLGQKLADEPETFAWRDAGGDAVQVILHDGVVKEVRLARAAAAGADA
ncbi:MAG: hypothetical protein WAQ05_14375 [Rubrivivax sp.]